MTKQEIIKLAGSQNALAKILGITQGAVSQWGDKIPEGRYWQLMVLKPEWFKS
jgi:DNA-binding transcriptional regulator YdaS (Cro superfamily)